MGSVPAGRRSLSGSSRRGDINPNRGFTPCAYRLAVRQQSQELDPVKRKKLVQDADFLLQKGLGRPIVYHLRASTCWQPQLKGITLMVNSQYNGWRMDDWWLDR